MAIPVNWSAESREYDGDIALGTTVHQDPGSFELWCYAD
jgi:hypothetical protein